jgi:quercetin dioxygenase-like cupin family protein
MNTLKITADEMKSRIARFSDRKRNPGYFDDPTIPSAACRSVVPEIYLVMGEQTHYGTGDGRPPIPGERGTAMAMVECAPRYKAALHVHLRSTEIFMCLKGRFEVRWNDAGEDRTMLEQFDTISIPPGLYREFTNITDDTALLLVVITGEADDDGLVVAPHETKRLTERFGADVVDKLAALTGFQFAGTATK